MNILVTLGLVLLLAGCATIDAGPHKGPVRHLTGEPRPLSELQMGGDYQVAVYVEARGRRAS